MMDPAYFVGKVELINWLNETLKLNYSKVEQVVSPNAPYKGTLVNRMQTFEESHGSTTKFY